MGGPDAGRTADAGVKIAPSVPEKHRAQLVPRDPARFGTIGKNPHQGTELFP